MTSLIVAVDPESLFPIQNLPFGVFSRSAADDHEVRSIGVRIGDYVFDFTEFTRRATQDTFPTDHLSLEQANKVFVTKSVSLNAFLSLSRPAWRAARVVVTQALTNPDTARDLIIPVQDVTMHLPAEIGDYTDFYSSKQHATNLGAMFRGRDNALMPNWLHLPVAYHGRSSSIVVSGTPICRPRGQIVPPPVPEQTPPGPRLGPTARLDFELEVAFLVGGGGGGGGAGPGTPLTPSQARERIFGLVLMNDWSARDVQKWEYQPLGPFTAKNFATTISPWVVMLEALEPFAVEAPKQDPPVLPYLDDGDIRRTFDIDLSVAIRAQGSSKRAVLSQTNFKHLYWTMEQQLTHHTVSGCNMRPGDLLASGTISGDERGALGSLVEMTCSGRDPVEIAEGKTRTFLEDGDEVIMTGSCRGHGYTVGFGECTGVVMGANFAEE